MTMAAEVNGDITIDCADLNQDAVAEKILRELRGEK